MTDRYVIANWKMNLPPEGIDEYTDALNRIEGGKAKLVVAPPYTCIERVARRLRDGHGTAAQNCSDHDKGAFTGDVSGAQLKDAGCTWVLCGHSERRQYRADGYSPVSRKH